jgi:hypothetical protein
MNLTDAISLRSNELSRILAGCVAIDPLWTLPKLEKLHTGALTDIQADRFIETVKGHQNELEGASVEVQCKLMARIACENRLHSEYMQWITLPYCLYQDAPTAIKELQSLTITKHTINGLQGWIRDQEAYINAR